MKIAERINVWKPRKDGMHRRPKRAPMPLIGPSPIEYRADRFLALGTEGATLRVGHATYRIEDLPGLAAAIASDGAALVGRIVERALCRSGSKALPFALAMAAASGDEVTRKAAFAALGKVCRTGPELFEFLDAVQSGRGWGRGLRNAVAAWYVEAHFELLESEAGMSVKGWTHRDAMRMAHPKPGSDRQSQIFQVLSASGAVPHEAVPPPLTAAILATEMTEWIPTDKRILVAVDSTASMRTWKIAGSSLSASEVAAIVALGIAKSEPQTTIAAWGSSVALVPVSEQTTVSSLMRSTRGRDVVPSNIALPILFALGKKLRFDCIVLLTDNETGPGSSHPAHTVPPTEALERYRQALGIDAKLIVVGMCSNGFCIADPTDPGMLDVVGFDVSVPLAMREFVVA